MGNKVRILSLDGGGIRGIIPATVMEYVENKLIEITHNPNARIADYFDMIVGTSTGGILGCFYLTPSSDKGSNKPSSKYPAGKALEFYSVKGDLIFNKSKRHSWFGLRQIVNATSYSPDNLEKIFREEFGDLRFGDLLKRCVVTTYNMASQSSFFFNSREEAHKKREFFLRDAVRSTSAAPTYFPAARIKNLSTNVEMINIDGGVFANNPAMCAYAEARHTKFEKVEYPSAKEMLILSIGTGGGSLTFKDLDSVGDWGAINWAKTAPDIMMDGSVDTVEFQMKQIFDTLDEENKLNYKRIDVPQGKRDYASDMADASPENIKKLKAAGQLALNEALNASDKHHGLDRFIELLVENHH
jgi:patatin-like phospholipase/acyl hydrolase